MNKSLYLKWSAVCKQQSETLEGTRFCRALSSVSECLSPIQLVIVRSQLLALSSRSEIRNCNVSLERSRVFQEFCPQWLLYSKLWNSTENELWTCCLVESFLRRAIAVRPLTRWFSYGRNDLPVSSFKMVRTEPEVSPRVSELNKLLV